MNNIILEGFIDGMKRQGCRFIKIDDNKIYFEIPEKISGEGMKKAKELFNSQGFRLFTKINKDLK